MIIMIIMSVPVYVAPPSACARLDVAADATVRCIRCSRQYPMWPAVSDVAGSIRYGRQCPMHGRVCCLHGWQIERYHWPNSRASRPTGAKTMLRSQAHARTAPHCDPPHHAARHRTAPYRTAPHGTVPHGSARLGTARLGSARLVHTAHMRV